MQAKQKEKALSDCRPLNDPVGFWGKLVVWTILFNLLIFAGSLLIHKWGAMHLGTLAILLPTFGLPWLAVSPIRIAALKPKVLFLRAFSRDQNKDENPVRNFLRVAIPGRFALAGIRAPRTRASAPFRFLGEGALALAYLGSNRFELEAADRNWFARLLASAAKAHAIIIDLRSLTPLVHDEIELAVAMSREEGRLFLLVDGSQSDEQWLETLRIASKSQPGGLLHFKWLRVSEDLSEHDHLYRENSATLAAIPPTPMPVTEEALRKARDRVKEDDWHTSWWETPAGAFAKAGVPAAAVVAAVGWLHPSAGQLLYWALTAVFWILYFIAIRRLLRLAWRQKKLGTKPVPAVSSVVLGASILPISLLFVSIAILVMKKVADKSEQMQASIGISILSNGLEMYRLDGGTYPSNEQGLKALILKPEIPPIPERWEQIMEQIPDDPWGRPYRYRFPGTRDPAEFELSSDGPDGIEATGDDITSR
jgi:general secretion pathway protein G